MNKDHYYGRFGIFRRRRRFFRSRCQLFRREASFFRRLPRKVRLRDRSASTETKMRPSMCSVAFINQSYT